MGICKGTCWNCDVSSAFHHHWSIFKVASEAFVVKTGVWNECVFTCYGSE